jgi:hypothetical protein
LLPLPPVVIFIEAAAATAAIVVTHAGPHLPLQLFYAFLKRSPELALLV